MSLYNRYLTVPSFDGQIFSLCQVGKSLALFYDQCLLSCQCEPREGAWAFCLCSLLFCIEREETRPGSQEDAEELCGYDLLQQRGCSLFSSPEYGKADFWGTDSHPVVLVIGLLLGDAVL